VDFFDTSLHISMMLVLTKENETDNVIVTLNEKRTIEDPYYLFVFEHVTTKQQVKIVIPATAELSEYPDRYNEFTLSTSVLFVASEAGQFNYFVYEQESDSNTDTAGLALVETGKAVLNTLQFNYTGYETTTSYKGYGG